MEENELKELPVYLNQLPPEKLNSELLALIGSRGLLEFIKNKLSFNSKNFEILFSTCHLSHVGKLLKLCSKMKTS